MINISNLSTKEKFAIAEYIYSQSTGVLIKIDAEAVVKVLKTHGVKEAETVEMEEYSILMLINSNIPLADRDAIMKDYFIGNI